MMFKDVNIDTQSNLFKTIFKKVKVSIYQDDQSYIRF